MVPRWIMRLQVRYRTISDGDTNDATEELDGKTFADTITLIRNYWHSGLITAEENGEIPEPSKGSGLSGSFQWICSLISVLNSSYLISSVMPSQSEAFLPSVWKNRSAGRASVPFL